MDWTSYFLGVATLPAILVLALLARALVHRIGSRRRSDLGELAEPGALSALDFTPRLVGQIRRRVEPSEESAKAS